MVWIQPSAVTVIRSLLCDAGTSKWKLACVLMVMDLGGRECGQGSAHRSSWHTWGCSGWDACGSRPSVCSFLRLLSVKQEDQCPGPDPPLLGGRAWRREGGWLPAFEHGSHEGFDQFFGSYYLGSQPSDYLPKPSMLHTGATHALGMLSLPGWLSGKNLPAHAGDARGAGSIPGTGRSPGGGNGNLLQHSCLENSMDRRAWWATVHGDHKKSDMTEWLHYFFNFQERKVKQRHID